MKNIFKTIVLAILTAEARLVLSRYKPKVIAVTGSVGKTSAKDAIYSVVSTSFPTRKNEKSYNAEFGVPLTILDLPNAWNSPLGWLKNLLIGFWRASTCYLIPSTYPEWLVLEVGADHPGDIKKIANWINPCIGVVTGLGNEAPVHVEFFPSIESLVHEKSELLRSLDSADLAIINRDDERAWAMRSATKAHVLSYGFNKEALVRGDSLHVAYDSDNARPTGLNFRIDYREKSIPIRLTGVLGRGHAYSALAAFAVGTRLGINLVTIAEALSKHRLAPGRMRILNGINGSVLIDDSYNSSPTAVKLALEALAVIEIPAPHSALASRGKKIAVLGDMAELGEYSDGEHKKVGTWIPGVADVLVCVGPKARAIGESATKECMDKSKVMHFENSSEAGNFLKDFVQPGDVVLIKGSQSMRMERVTESLLAEPSKASELLVRQEEDWLNKY